MITTEELTTRTYKKPLLYANKDKLEAISHLPQCGDHQPIMVKFLALYYTGILARTSQASPSVSISNELFRQRRQCLLIFNLIMFNRISLTLCQRKSKQSLGLGQTLTCQGKRKSGSKIHYMPIFVFWLL